MPSALLPAIGASAAASSTAAGVGTTAAIGGAAGAGANLAIGSAAAAGAAASTAVPGWVGALTAGSAALGAASSVAALVNRPKTPPPPPTPPSLGQILGQRTNQPGGLPQLGGTYLTSGQQSAPTQSGGKTLTGQ